MGSAQVDFFISYNKADHEWASWIAWTLEAAGYSTVHEQWDFRPGGNFALEMQQALARSDRVIAVLSPTYLTGVYASTEWAAAFATDPQGNDRRLVPVKVRECEPDGLLKAIIYIDLVGLPVDAARSRLLGGLSVARDKPLTAPPFPGATRPVMPDSVAAPAVEATRQQVAWQHLTAPVQVTWRSETQAGRAQRALLEVHLVPVPEMAPIEVRAMRQLGDTLASTARAFGLFTQAQAIDLMSDANSVTAFDGTGAGGPGLLLTRSGQRGGWAPLPQDMLGAILDEADVMTRILGLLRVLAETKTPEPERVAIAIGVQPANLVTLGTAADVGQRTSASMSIFAKTNVRWTPTDSVMFADIRRNADDISAELAARINTMFEKI